jgi:hypothetical protein
VQPFSATFGKMNTEQKARWEKIRQKGQFRFILGKTLFWGFAGTFLSIVVDYSFEFFSNAPSYLHESDRFVTEILFRLFLSSLFGFFIGNSSWDENENKFFQNLDEK